MDVETLQSKFEILAPALTERSRRLWAATEALALGHGGIALVARATGMARSTISRGIQELESGEALNPDRARRPGRRSQANDRQGHRTAGGSGGVARSDDRGLARRAIALDFEKYAQAGGRTAGDGAHGESSPGRGGCCVIWATPCKRIERPAKARNIPIGTLSSSISTTRCLDVRSGGAR